MITAVGDDEDIHKKAFDLGANDFLERAQKITRKYAPVFVLAGDIFESKKDAGQACSMYEQAILFDANC